MKNEAPAAMAKPCPNAEYLRRKAEFEAQDKAALLEGARLVEEHIKRFPLNGH